MKSLKDKTLFITGASRGIGKAIALRAAKDGANVIIAAKTTEPHPKLDGTIYTAAEEIEKAGGKALALPTDIRSDENIQESIQKGAEHFGGIDILINNASAISLTGTLRTSAKRYDLMNTVNARGTFLCSKHAHPFLKKSDNPHILILSPPPTLDPKWYKDFTAYTMAKMGMSMCVLGMSAEFKEDGIAVNGLWPRTTIATAAILHIVGGEEMMKVSRKPEIMADAAHEVLCMDSKSKTGNFFIDEEVLKEAGMSDLDQYAVTPGARFKTDLYLD